MEQEEPHSVEQAGLPFEIHCVEQAGLPLETHYVEQAELPLEAPSVEQAGQQEENAPRQGPQTGRRAPHQGGTHQLTNRSTDVVDTHTQGNLRT